jgi:thiol-disulfide isomerase/thioredoxin
MPVPRPRWLTLVFTVLVVALSLNACRARALSHHADDVPTKLDVLMINGGGTRAQNYQSHLLHVQQLYALFLRVGVPRERISIFSGDGPDPAADLAVRELAPEGDFWLLRGTHLEHTLGAPITYANSKVEGATLEPATKTAIAAWFEKAAKRLRSGDTLLVYVTDHGTKNAEDTSNNAITLWGSKESLSVEELKELVAKLPAGVRVVTLMSQCFSGAFANLMSVGATDGRPSGNVCGYFSSTPDRPAYGCYPENRGKDNVGHSFHFIEALETTPELSAAHAQVLVDDQTPDVPNRTSDVYLEQRLDAAAKAAGKERAVLVDELLREAWHDRGAWETDIRLLDRIAHSFGFASPRSLEELDRQTHTLPDLSPQLKNQERAWRASLGDLAEANLGRFLAAHPDWGKRAAPQAVAALDGPASRTLTSSLLDDLKPFTRDDRTTDTRIRLLNERAEASSAIAYRMEVRLAAVLRLRAILTSVAGRVYLATRASPAERDAYQALHTCEELRIAPGPLTPAVMPAAADEPFPPFDDDVRLATTALPAWMGISFRQANDKRRSEARLQDGAVAVLAVYPDSPAQTAGLEVGDILLGPPDQPFKEPHQVREWTMLSAVGRPAELEVLREGARRRLTLVPKPFPLKWPELPGPPKVGSAAPSLDLGSYRGAVPKRLADGKPRLLFFWATWCGPCKAALPEALAFEQQRKTQVIAITDEPGEQLDAFFKKFADPFPEAVATDEFRRAFQAYAVSGTPSFVLIDTKGQIGAEFTGYAKDKGLPIDGWSWAKPKTAASAQP